MSKQVNLEGIATTCNERKSRNDSTFGVRNDESLIVVQLTILFVEVT